MTTIGYTQPEHKVTAYGDAWVCPTEKHMHDTESQARTCAEDYHIARGRTVIRATEKP